MGKCEPPRLRFRAASVPAIPGSYLTPPATFLSESTTFNVRASRILGMPVGWASKIEWPALSEGGRQETWEQLFREVPNSDHSRRSSVQPWGPIFASETLSSLPISSLERKQISPWLSMKRIYGLQFHLPIPLDPRTLIQCGTFYLETDQGLLRDTNNHLHPTLPWFPSEEP